MSYPTIAPHKIFNTAKLKLLLILKNTKKCIYTFHFTNIHDMEYSHGTKKGYLEGWKKRYRFRENKTNFEILRFSTFSIKWFNFYPFKAHSKKSLLELIIGRCLGTAFVIKFGLQSYSHHLRHAMTLLNFQGLPEVVLGRNGSLLM